MIFPNILINTFDEENITSKMFKPEIIAEFGMCVSATCFLTSVVMVLLANRIKSAVSALSLVLAFITTSAAFVITLYILKQSQNLSFTFLASSKINNRVAILYAACMLGCTEGIISTRIITNLGVQFRNNLPEAFSMFKLFQTGSISISYALGSYISLAIRIYGMIAIHLIGTCLFALNLWKTHNRNIKVPPSEIEPKSS